MGLVMNEGRCVCKLLGLAIVEVSACVLMATLLDVVEYGLSVIVMGFCFSVTENNFCFKKIIVFPHLYFYYNNTKYKMS